MKTLAEMTPEERAECVGMWCETTYGKAQGVRLFCGEGWDEFMHRGIVAKMIRPNEEGFGFVPFSDVTPRFDLPRAWNPDGTPARMERGGGRVSRTEYRVIHKTPGVMSPAPASSMADAVDYMRRAERYLVQPGDLKIQYCTITEWEDV